MFILVDKVGEGHVCVAVNAIISVVDTRDGARINLNSQDGVMVLEVRTTARQVFEFLNAQRVANERRRSI